MGGGRKGGETYDLTTWDPSWREEAFVGFIFGIGCCEVGKMEWLMAAGEKNKERKTLDTIMSTWKY